MKRKLDVDTTVETYDALGGKYIAIKEKSIFIDISNQTIRLDKTAAKKLNKFLEKYLSKDSNEKK